MFVVEEPLNILESISIASVPYKTEYCLGEELETDGLAILLTYTNGSKKTVKSGFTISEFDSETAGMKEIYVSFEGKETVFFIMVIDTGCKHIAGSYVVDSVPTCTKDGRISCHCILCNSIIENTVIVVKAYGHTAGEWIVIIEPDCNSSGEHVKYCSECGEIIERETIAPQHTHGYWMWIVEPQNGNRGIRARVCSKCHTVYESEAAFEIDEMIGDGNGDGKIDAQDLTILIKYLLNSETLNQSPALDTNGDGIINILDLVTLKKHLADNTVPLGKQNNPISNSQVALEIANLPENKIVA